MNIKLIKTESDYRKALKRLDEIFDAKIGTPESDEADILGMLVDEFEKKHYPIDAPDPIEAIKIRMEEMQLKQIDLADALGGACFSDALACQPTVRSAVRWFFDHLPGLIG